MSFKIGNCRINVSIFFFIMLCICSLADKSGIMICGIIAALLHECGHLISALSFGLRLDSVTLSSAGIRIHISNLENSRKACITTALSGALTNLLLFAVSFMWFEGFAAANLSLCLLSLLPCEPFDGSIVLRSVLSFHLSDSKTENIVFIFTLIFLFLLVAFGSYVLIRSRYNFSLLTLSMLIFTSICQRTLK